MVLEGVPTPKVFPRVTMTIPAKIKVRAAALGACGCS